MWYFWILLKWLHVVNGAICDIEGDIMSIPAWQNDLWYCCAIFFSPSHAPSNNIYNLSTCDACCMRLIWWCIINMSNTFQQCKKFIIDIIFFDCLERDIQMCSNVLRSKKQQASQLKLNVQWRSDHVICNQKCRITFYLSFISQ